MLRFCTPADGMVHPVLRLMVYHFPTLHWGDHETSRSPPTLLDPKNNSNRWFFRLSGAFRANEVHKADYRLGMATRHVGDRDRQTGKTDLIAAPPTLNTVGVF